MARRSGGGATLAIDCAAAAAPYPDLDDDESYSLKIDASQAVLTAATEWGVLRGLATLAQLTGPRKSLPGCADRRHAAFRVARLDDRFARHFISVGTLLRTLDAMALFKLNVLHLHLTRRSGRFGSRQSRLPGTGAARQRRATTTPKTTSGDIVSHAAELGIRVVPEIDMPGHTTSWLVAHPEWGTVNEARTRFGSASARTARASIRRATKCTKRSGRLFDDVTRVFPDRFLHIGGDEVNPKWWQESAAVQRFMRERGIADIDSLQNLFNERLADLLIDRGRMLVGWDEIAHSDLPRTSVVQSWRGGASRDRAVAQGFDCVFSAGYYLDFFYPADLHYAYDPESPSEELLRLDERVRADPRLAHVRDGLGWASEFAGRSAVDVSSSDAPNSTPPGRVLGGEACMWAEIVNDEVFEGRVWGRLPAIAERLWSPRSLRDESDMYLRLAQLRPVLAAYADVDIEARRRESFARIGVSAAELDALQDLFDAIEPIKWYSRLLGAAALRARVAGFDGAG